MTTHLPRKTSMPQSVAAYAFSRLFRCFRYLHHGHIGAPLEALLEHDPAADLGEQSVVFAHRDIGARMHCRAALSHDDVARKHDLSAVALDPEPLAIGVATVARRPACFLVCHDNRSLRHSDTGVRQPAEMELIFTRVRS